MLFGCRFVCQWQREREIEKRFDTQKKQHVMIQLKMMLDKKKAQGANENEAS